MGRWSRLAASAFVDWLNRPAGERWLEAGCGTGALTSTVLAQAAPALLVAMDLSLPFLSLAQRFVAGASFVACPAGRLAAAAYRFDVAVSALALNFFPDPAAALGEQRRVVRPGGTVAAYVWDYAGEMQMLRTFWDVAAALDPAARRLDEGLHFPQQDAEWAALFRQAGLRAVETAAIDVRAVYRDFHDFWQPFLDGPAPAPLYVQALAPPQQAALAERLQAALPAGPDGAITLANRAWAVRGVV